MATPSLRRRDCLPSWRSLPALFALLSVLLWTPSALPAGNPPVNTERPAISGSARYGQTLTGTQGVWTGAQPMTFTYQWRRCDDAGNNCADLPSATALTYTLGTDEIGGRVHLRVTATNADGSSNQRSWNSAVIISEPINTALPSLSGVAPSRATPERLGNAVLIGSETITAEFQEHWFEDPSAFVAVTPKMDAGRRSHRYRACM